MQYAKYTTLKINWKGIPHQFFSYGNYKVIWDIILKNNADILFLQEIPSHEIAHDLAKQWWYTHVYIHTTPLLSSYTAVLSNTVLNKDTIPCVCGDFTIYSWQRNLHFIPIHLDARSSKIRLQQCNDILTYQNDRKTIVLWDFNFRQRGKYYLFHDDKYSVQKLSSIYTEVITDLPSTTAGLRMDRVFTANIAKENIKAYIHPYNWVYMDHYPVIIEVTM